MNIDVSCKCQNVILVCGVAIVRFLATSESNFPFSMERLFCVYVRYNVVRISFHFQFLWRSMFVISLDAF